MSRRAIFAQLLAVAEGDKVCFSRFQNKENRFVRYRLFEFIIWFVFVVATENGKPFRAQGECEVF